MIHWILLHSLSEKIYGEKKKIKLGDVIDKEASII